MSDAREALVALLWERVRQALRESRRNGLGGMTEAQALDHMTDAVLAVVRPSGQEGS